MYGLTGTHQGFSSVNDILEKHLLNNCILDSTSITPTCQWWLEHRARNGLKSYNDLSLISAVNMRALLVCDFVSLLQVFFKFKDCAMALMRWSVSNLSKLFMYKKKKNQSY